MDLTKIDEYPEPPDEEYYYEDLLLINKVDDCEEAEKVSQVTDDYIQNVEYDLLLNNESKKAFCISIAINSFNDYDYDFMSITKNFKAHLRNILNEYGYLFMEIIVELNNNESGIGRVIVI